MSLPIGGPRTTGFIDLGGAQCWADPRFKTDEDVENASGTRVCNSRDVDDELLLCPKHRAIIIGEVASVHELPALPDRQAVA